MSFIGSNNYMSNTAYIVFSKFIEGVWWHKLYFSVQKKMATLTIPAKAAEATQSSQRQTSGVALYGSVGSLAKKS
jgi:hypothetical protein